MDILRGCVSHVAGIISFAVKIPRKFLPFPLSASPDAAWLCIVAEVLQTFPQLRTPVTPKNLPAYQIFWYFSRCLINNQNNDSHEKISCSFHRNSFYGCIGLQ